MEKSEKKIAILIDAENISPKYARQIFDEVSAFGVVTYKRIYGDWTTTRHSTWKETIKDFAIVPRQHFAYSSGKNATDGALIIDAMDILYSGTVDCFCLVSSDSDFNALATRLRESAMYLIGMGERKNKLEKHSSVNAFNKYIYLDVLSEQEQVHEEEVSKKKDEVKEKTPTKSKSPKKVKLDNQKTLKDKEILKDLFKITEDCGNFDGFADLSLITNRLIKIRPDFDIRTFGFKKMSDFILSLNKFEVKKEGLAYFIRLKN